MLMPYHSVTSRDSDLNKACQNHMVSMNISRMEPEKEVPLPCLEITCEIPFIDRLQGPHHSNMDEERLFMYDIHCPDVCEPIREPNLVGGSVNAHLQNGEVAEKRLYQIEDDLLPESCHKYDVQVRKRADTAFGREYLKNRKLRSTASLDAKADSKQSASGGKEPVNNSKKWSKRISKNTGTKTCPRGPKASLPGKKLIPVLSSATSKEEEDIIKTETDFEYQRCVSLLREYGVLNSPEFHKCQNYPACAPHPGYAGDGVQSKQCKACKAVENSTNTIICDGCQEVFHLPCCLPRVSNKYFDREDDWFCSSCRKQRKRTNSFHCFKLSDNSLDNTNDGRETRYFSRVRLGSAHQVDVPLWTGKVQDDPTTSPLGRPGTEVPFSEEEKAHERGRIMEDFKNKIAALNWAPAETPATEIPENWLRCQNIFAKGYKDKEGHEHNDVVCGKWRRAPAHVQQTDCWECFCVMEWDPLHADCAVPQELPTEEILCRLLQVKPENQRQ